MLKQIVIVLAVIAAVLPAFAEDVPATSQAATQAASPKELAKTIDDAIALLEAGKNREVVEMLLQTEMLAEITKKGDMDILLEGFAGKKAEAMLKALKAAKGQMPTMNADGSEASFAGDGKAVTFILEEKKWHLKGH